MSDDNDSISYTAPITIVRRSNFEDLYADTGIVVPQAPGLKNTVKFNDAVTQYDDDDLAQIRAYDRARSGGFVNG